MSNAGGCALGFGWPYWPPGFPDFSAGAQEFFPTLKVGSVTFSNVTITGKTPTHVSFNHERGFATLKLSHLDTNLLMQLGYQMRAEPPRSAPATSTNSTGTNQVEAVNPPVKGLEMPRQFHLDPRLLEMQRRWTEQGRDLWQKTERRWLWAGGAVLVLLYLGFCYCVLLICEKAGYNSGPLAWLPLLNWIPLLRAAGMSAWMLLLYPIPIVGLIVHLVWCLKICRVRGKSHWLGLLLYLPATNVLTFLYLAFSDASTGTPEPPRKVQLSFSNRPPA